MVCKELRRLALTETRRARLGAIQIDDALGNVKGITCRRRRGPGRGDLSCHACAFVERERGASVWDGSRARSNESRHDSSAAGMPRIFFCAVPSASPQGLPAIPSLQRRFPRSGNPFQRSRTSFANVKFVTRAGRSPGKITRISHSIRELHRIRVTLSESQGGGSHYAQSVHILEVNGVKYILRHNAKRWAYMTSYDRTHLHHLRGYGLSR